MSFKRASAERKRPLLDTILMKESKSLEVTLIFTFDKKILGVDWF